MDRREIEYDFLPRESEILHLHFWDAAFAKLKEAGVLLFETQGKNKGCWVMRRAGASKSGIAEGAGAGAEGAPEEQSSRDEQKIIVRTKGTLRYLRKNIAYHMSQVLLPPQDFRH